MAHNRTMDDKEFRRRLSEVAEWRIPKTEQETSIAAKRKRGRKSAEEEYMALREEIFQQEFDGINNTIPPMLTKIKAKAKDCEDCGKHCENGRQIEAKLHTKGVKQAWRKKCLTCNRFENPFTGEFNLTGAAASIKWNDFMRETKGIYKTRGNAERARLKVQQQTDKTVMSNDAETITFYHDIAKQK